MTGSARSHQRLRPKVFAAFGIAVSIILLGGCFSILWQRSIWLHEKLSARLTSVHSLFVAEIDREAKLVEAVVDSLEKDAELRKAWLAGDREALLTSALPRFEEIRARYRITHCYFLDREGVCFLRVHNPPRYGDTVARTTLTEAARTGQTVSGLELGPFGTFTLRVVRPWHIDGQLVGYIELGEEIKHAAMALKNILDAELFFAINKSCLNWSEWQEGLKMTGLAGEWDLAEDFVFVDRTLDEVPQELIEHLSVVHAEHAGREFSFSHGSRIYRCGILELKDAGGRDVGDIFALIDTTQGASTLNKLLAIQIVSGICVSVALSGIFWRYLGRVEQQLTRTRDELEVALHRERSFADDVAHELRTPLAGIRSTIDVALSVDRDTDEFRESLCDCSGIVDRMQSLVDKLMMLARLDGKQPILSEDRVDLAKIVDTCWEPLQERAAGRRLAFENQVPDGFTCLSDRDSLTIVFSNLLENSVNYTNEGGRIWVTAARGARGTFRVAFGNTGCNLDKTQAWMAFQQFWRADTSRDGGGQHTGLGLALVHRLTAALGGDAFADVTDDGVFTVHISLGRSSGTQPVAEHVS